MRKAICVNVKNEIPKGSNGCRLIFSFKPKSVNNQNKYLKYIKAIILQAMARYILVVKTYYSNVTGAFLIIANGPAPVNFIGG